MYDYINVKLLHCSSLTSIAHYRCESGYFECSAHHSAAGGVRCLQLWRGLPRWYPRPLCPPVGEEGKSSLIPYLRCVASFLSVNYHNPDFYLFTFQFLFLFVPRPHSFWCIATCAFFHNVEHAFGKNAYIHTCKSQQILTFKWQVWPKTCLTFENVWERLFELTNASCVFMSTYYVWVCYTNSYLSSHLGITRKLSVIQASLCIMWSVNTRDIFQKNWQLCFMHFLSVLKFKKRKSIQ